MLSPVQATEPQADFVEPIRRRKTAETADDAGPSPSNYPYQGSTYEQPPSFAAPLPLSVKQKDEDQDQVESWEEVEKHELSEELEEEDDDSEETRPPRFCVGCCILIIVIIVVVTIVASACDGNKVRDSLNKEQGVMSPDFARKTITPRPDYQAKVEALGLTYHDEPSLMWSKCELEEYWDEKGAIEITPKAENELILAT